MNPLHLTRFAAVAEAQSFSAAARALGVDQATLSRQVRLLEQELGFTLFTRTTRTVVLTAHGQALLPEAQALADALRAAQNRIRLLANDNDKRIRFGMHPFVYWLPQVRTLLEAFAASQPDAATETVSGMSARNLSRLRAGTLDAALVLRACAGATYDMLPAFEVLPHIVLPAEHPMIAEPVIQASDIAGLPVAIFRPGKDREDFDEVYGPVFRMGAEPVYVSEGAAAVVFHAAADRLAMISLRPLQCPAPQGFVRKAIMEVELVHFSLVRMKREDRGTLNRFWNIARNLMDD